MRLAADTVTLTLKRYADRGVFRGLRVEPGRGGRLTYEFNGPALFLLLAI